MVHGLNGSTGSWQGDERKFVENLRSQSLVNENFDVSLFGYTTKIVQFRLWARFKSLLGGLIRSRTQEELTGFNVGVDKISRALGSTIDQALHEYKSVSLIGHSMGGLVAKSALTWLSPDKRKKVAMFFSLSVPHIGARLANIGKSALLIFGNNPQIKDLRLFGDFTSQLDARYSILDPRPKVICQCGNLDAVVGTQPAILPGTPLEDVVTTSDDHFSVLLIDDRDTSVLFKRLIRELRIVLQPFEAISIDVPEGSSFNDIISIIVSKAKIRIDTSLLSGNELNSMLHAGKVGGFTVGEVLTELCDLAKTPFSDYKIDYQRPTRTYRFQKKL